MLDTFTAQSYISTPVPFRVDLAKSQMVVAPEQASAYQPCAVKEHPKHAVPPLSFADVACFHTNRSTDLIALIKSVNSTTRKTKNNQDVTDVELVDDSKKPSGKLAIIDVGVFGKEKIEELRAGVGAPFAFFNLAVACSGASQPRAKPGVNISHYKEEMLVPAPACTKTSEMLGKKCELKDSQETEKLTSSWNPQ